MFNSEQLEKKWAPILEAKDAPAFKDNYRRAITSVMLENQERALQEERAQSGFLGESTTTSAVSNWDPVLIALVRRAMPNLIAYDIASVQPMNMPTGLIFAMKSNYQNYGGAGVTKEAFMKDIDTAFSGSVAAETGEGGLRRGGIATSAGEALTGNATGTGATGDGGGFGNMGFTIEKQTVTAVTRALKAEYTMELAQDLKAVHGLDAEGELANILSTEILAEINREIINTVNSKAKFGGVLDPTYNEANFPSASTDSVIQGSGTFNLDTEADGRWFLEKVKGLLFQLEVEANRIAKDTRRGKGNFVVCSSNVASALAAAGVLAYAPALSTNLNVDDTGNTFAGVLNGRMKVFVDPYATTDYATVGFRGSNNYDAGLFYCPYVPLTMVRAVDPNSFQPKIGFKTRYGLVANPYAGGAVTSSNPEGVVTSVLGHRNSNQYFRKLEITGLGGVSPEPYSVAD
jgi:hypothetical protein